MDKNINIKLKNLASERAEKKKEDLRITSFKTYHKEVRFSKCSTFSTKAHQ